MSSEILIIILVLISIIAYQIYSIREERKLKDEIKLKEFEKNERDKLYEILRDDLRKDIDDLYEILSLSENKQDKQDD